MSRFVCGAWVALWLVAAVPAHATDVIPVQDTSALTFADPAMAQAQVRKLLLPNGVRVYLLHDPGAKTDAVACGVRAGSWQDPQDAPGMAHFVEHLLFMGTADYPDEADFYAYLARHGGNTNAYTTVDRTVYMFDVEAGGLRGSMLRFGAFFKNPLLRDASIAREINAVDQEFRTKERLDGWREAMVDAALSNPAHPNHWYHIGTRASLAHVDHNAMERWFTQNYSAHVMDVVVRGAQSLDVLQAAVVAGFSDVPRRAVDVPRIDVPLFESHMAASTLVLEPSRASTRELSIKWELPIGNDDKAAHRACDLLAYLLDSQGRNSLLARLREEGLAEDISILPRHFASGRTLLTVSFDVTDRGVLHRDAVLGLLFAALGEFRDVARVQPLLRELQGQTWRRYAWAGPSPGYDAVAKTADQILTEPLETFPDIAADARVQPQAWSELLRRLTPEAALVTVLALGARVGAGLSEDGPAWHVEPRMHVRYALLHKSVPQASAKVAPGFGVPAPNPWMPDASGAGVGGLAAAEADAPTLENPLHLVDDGYASIYVARDRPGNNPRLGLVIDIKTPLADASDASGAALYDLWWLAADAQLQDLQSDAEAAGLHLRIEPTAGGVRVVLHGFAEKAPKLLEVVLRRLTHLAASLTEERVDTLRTRLMRTYDDARNARPRDLAYASLGDWSMERAYGIAQKRVALEALGAGDLAQAARQIFAQVYTEASLYGNVDLRTAYQCYAAINRHLRHAVYPEGKRPDRRGRDMTKLEAPVRLLRRGGSARGNAVVLRLCEGDDTPRNKAASTILSHAIEPLFFDVLRTREQVAYSLSTSGISRDGQLFRSFAVSPFHLSAAEASRRIDAFVRQTAASLGDGGITREAFDAYKAAVRTQWATDPEQVASGSERLQWLAFDRRGDFLLVRRRLEALDSLDYETFSAYARRALTTPYRVEAWVSGSGSDFAD